jgi:hypothetical protein|uniref:Uncharacterized protein n=1 Tax=Oryza sativa subsp. japonica TaxID=39947 RepID=Q6EPM6_ORYSJ|nr:hypothetical protein [Oryza sativa Japonica Group]
MDFFFNQFGGRDNGMAGSSGGGGISLDCAKEFHLQEEDDDGRAMGSKWLVRWEGDREEKEVRWRKWVPLYFLCFYLTDMWVHIFI